MPWPTGIIRVVHLILALDSRFRHQRGRRNAMAKYLLEACYTSDGAKGLLKDGGSKRRAAADAAIKSVGGHMEAFYYAFGDADAILILDAPDNATVTA